MFKAVSAKLAGERRLIALACLIAVLLITIGCGSGANSPSSTTTTGTGTGSGTGTGTGSGSGSGGNASAQVKIGDAPADRVLTFEVSVGPITLTPTSGSVVTVLSASQRLELSHLSGTSEPLALLNIPQGSYSSASLTVSNPQVTFINSAGAVVKLEPAFNKAITVAFSPALSIGANSSVISIDLNVAKSLTFDATGNVTGVAMSASSFAITTAVVAAEDRQHAEDGELEDTNGLVTAVSGSSFTMTLGQNGVSLTFATDASTEFNDGATLATMLNTIVKVEGLTRADGSLYAKEVEGMESENGAELEGLINSAVGNPASQLSFVAHDGLGSGMDDSKVGSTLTADVSGARYKVNKGNIDTSGIGNLPSSPNFPFDASTVHAGQSVEIESDRSIAASPVVADKVKLQQQALTGTVSGLPGATSAGPVTFTLTVPSDSAFAILSGQNTITVYWQPGTDLHNLSSVNNGDSVRVRGLVFFTGSSFNMIARRIDQ